jgi:nucleoside-diphosphate-sugar epimerase
MIRIEDVHRVMDETRPALVFHLAALVSVSRAVDVVLPAFEGSLRATVNLLIAAHESKVSRVVLAGSTEEPFPGDARLTPRSPYGAAKFGSTIYGNLFAELYGLSVVTARLFMVYGPAQFDLQRLVPYVIVSLLRNENPKLTSGRRAVDWIHVADVVDGLVELSCCNAPDVWQVDIGTGQTTTVRDIVGQLVELVPSRGRPEFGALPDRPLEVMRVADIGTTERMLGWRPTIGLAEGLAQTVGWYRNRLRVNGSF